MEWQLILKGLLPMDKDYVPHKGKIQDKLRRKPRTKIIGGTDTSKIKDIEEASLDFIDKDYEDLLAESTRQQLIDAFSDSMKELSKEELIKILIKTRGDITVKTPKL